VTVVLADLPAEVQHAVAETRQRVADLHAELPRNQLVVWTAGNVSERVPHVEGVADQPQLLVIKPSGVSYDELSAENMVVCTLDGKKIEYEHMDEVGGVVHTHSTYATAWAARGEEIPCVLTMMGDEFGGPIPVGPFAIIGDDSIGRGIVETLRESRSRAVLMQNHGPFTIGKDAKDAVKAAVMAEEVARTVHISRQLGEPIPIPNETIDRLFDRYQNVYGQKSAGVDASTAQTTEA
jgi:L-ribulose-5-phosphate 4-epimerase